jgi:hypothetical protein
LTQAGFAAPIRYWASRPGAVSVTVRGRAGVVARRIVTASGGDGELALESVPPGRYAVRLRLTTASGGVAETVEHVDTRRTLPLRAGRTALKRAYEDSDGDEGGGNESDVAGCRRRSARVIGCVLLYRESINEFGDPEPWRWSTVSLPSAHVTATLRADGVHTAARLLRGGYDAPEACLRAAARRHQGAAGSLRVRVRATCAVPVRIAAHLRWRAHGQLQRAIQIRTRGVGAGTTWQATIPLPRRALAAVRARRHVTGEIVVRAHHPGRSGPVQEEHGFPLVLDR